MIIAPSSSFRKSFLKSPPYRVSTQKYPFFARIRPFLSKFRGFAPPNNFRQLRLWSRIDLRKSKVGQLSKFPQNGVQVFLACFGRKIFLWQRRRKKMSEFDKYLPIRRSLFKIFGVFGTEKSVTYRLWSLPLRRSPLRLIPGIHLCTYLCML